MNIPKVDKIDKYILQLVQMVAQTSYLPHPNVVKAVRGAVFPTARARKNHPRFSHILDADNPIGMYDDNVTPRWAILWAHDKEGSRTKGWTFAHVWPVTDDIKAFTHLANLIMVNESFASLTDKNGPLTAFLRWHAWKIYAWKPELEVEPIKPAGYDDIKWRYLEGVENPKELIKARLNKFNNQCTKVLRPIMKSRKML